MRSIARVCAIVAGVSCSWGVTEVAVAQEPPSFAQLAGRDGCVVAEPDPRSANNSLASVCGTARGLWTGSGIALSPDERHVYATSSHGGLVAFARNPGSGALSFVGCITDNGEDGRRGSEGSCVDGDALAGATDVAVTPDGRFVYVTSSGSSSVTWFARDAASGALTQRGCLKDTPRGDRCGGAFGLYGAAGVDVAPDGRHVYIAANWAGAVVAFQRDTDSGALSPVGCVSDSGSDGLCVNGAVLAGAQDVVVAPDGGSAYIAANGALAAFTRDATTGALAQRGCLLTPPALGGPCTEASGIASVMRATLTPDGAQLLVASQQESQLSVFGASSLAPAACYRHAAAEGDDRETPPEGNDDGEEDEQTGDDGTRSAQPSSCRPAKALGGVTAIAVSRDGRSVFTSGAASHFAAFQRDPGSGALEQYGCLEAGTEYRSCAPTHGVTTGNALVATGDGRNVYVISYQGITVLGTSVAIVSRSARVSRGERIGVRLLCPAARVSGCRGRLRAASSAAARYHLRAGRAATVHVRMPPATSRALRGRGRASVAVIADDSERRVRPTGRRLTVIAHR